MQGHDGADDCARTGCHELNADRLPRVERHRAACRRSSIDRLRRPAGTAREVRWREARRVGPRIPVARRVQRCAQALVRRPQGHSRPCACIQPQALAPARAQQRSSDAAAAIAAVRVQPGTAAAQHARQCKASCAGCGHRRGGRRRSRGGSPAQRCPRRARAAQTLEPDGMSSGRVGQRGAGRCLLRASLSCSSAAVPTTSLACVRERLPRLVLVV